MAMKYEANTAIVLTIGAISGILLLVIMFGTEAWFRYEERAELNNQWDQNPNSWLQDIRAKQAANINHAFTDDDGHRHVTIDQAMQAVLSTGAKLPATQPSASATNAQ